jgi:hypothetical protein
VLKNGAVFSFWTVGSKIWIKGGYMFVVSLFIGVEQYNWLRKSRHFFWLSENRSD